MGGGYTSFESAWGEPAAPPPQKSIASGNVPQKVLAGGNVPQKSFHAPPAAAAAHDTNMQRMAMALQRQAAEVNRLQQMLAAAQSKPARKGMSVMEIAMVVMALVFIVLVLFLINAVSRLSYRF